MEGSAGQSLYNQLQLFKLSDNRFDIFQALYIRTNENYLQLEMNSIQIQKNEIHAKYLQKTVKPNINIKKINIT